MNAQEEEKFKEAQNFINLQLNEVKKDIMDVFLPPIVPSPLVSFKEQEQRNEIKTKELIQNYQIDIERGIKCFYEMASPSESKELNLFFNKLQPVGVFTENALVELEEKDVDFLDEIATRAILDHHFKEASCMWRLLIQFDMTNSRAWVGWAVSEQELGHKEIVTTIFDLALTLLPLDSYLAYFAADYEINEKNFNKAREILELTYQHLQDENLLTDADKKLLDEQMALVI